jgi:hypothetical protein
VTDEVLAKDRSREEAEGEIERRMGRAA